MSALAATLAFGSRLQSNRTAFAGALLLTGIVIMALTAPILFPDDPLRIVGAPLIWPLQDGHYPLGTDALGRDILALILHGARTTLLIGLCASLTALVIGITVGACAGFFSGLPGAMFSRLIELFQTIPGLIFIMATVAFLGPQLIWVVLAIGVVSWESIARLTRAEFMSWRKRDFIMACRGMGMGNARIIFGEILPNALPPVMAVFTLSVASAILVESGLSFLGLGDPSIPTWGRLVGEGRTLIRTDWYICALPGFAIMITVFALSLFSDGVNDILNPRSRNR